MARLRYYREEDARFPELDRRRARPWEAFEAVRRLVRRFSPKAWKRIAIADFRWTTGARSSRANCRRVILNVDRVSQSVRWLTVIHEVAHVIDHRRQGVKPVRWHGPKHRRIVATLARYVLRSGWSVGALAEPYARREDRVRARARLRSAACPPPLEGRIAERERQITRLDASLRRYAGIVKGIQTRRSRAIRSLAALRRRKET